MINKKQLKASFSLSMLCLMTKLLLNVIDSNSMSSKFMQTINILGASGYWYLPIMVGMWYVLSFTATFYLLFRIINMLLHFVYR